MAFEPIYNIVAMDARQRLCGDQIVVEARLIPPPGTSISKILVVSCTPDTSASECFTGEARYAGKVRFNVLFADADGGNHSMDYVADFSDKLTSERIESGMRAELSSRILDTDILNVSGGELKLATVVEVELFLSGSTRVKYLSAGGENIYVSEETIPFCRQINQGISTFGISEGLNGIEAVKLLMSEPRAITQKFYVGDGSVTAEGKVVCDMVFENKDGMLTSGRIEAPFSETVAADGAMPSHIIVARVKLSNSNIMFESDGETSGVNAEFTLEFSREIYEEEEVNAVVDAFCVSHELLSSTEGLEIVKNKLCIFSEDRVEGSVTLDINMPIVDNILAAQAAKLHVSNAHAQDGRAVLEGIVTASIVYYSLELNSKNSVAVELPFSLNVACDVKEGDIINACGEVDRVTVKIRRGNELDIKADVVLNIQVCEKATRTFISSISLGEERDVPTSAISIHIAKRNETLWDVAKSMVSTPELILLQNPNLTLPLSGGERIITYRQLVIE